MIAWQCQVLLATGLVAGPTIDIGAQNIICVGWDRDIICQIDQKIVLLPRPASEFNTKNI